LPGRSGLDLQRELAAADIQIPIIFITGHGDIPMSVQAMKGGAIEFLTKPFRDQDLIDAIHLGLARDRARRENEKALGTLRARFESLTRREREIMIQVVQGRLSKQIVYDLGISEVTVKVHRNEVAAAALYHRFLERIVARVPVAALLQRRYTVRDNVRECADEA
jgi:FixJ family two-component response regulator